MADGTNLEQGGQLGKTFRNSSDAKLNAPKPLDAKQYADNDVVFKASNGVTVFQKTPLTQEQVDDMKFVYKPTQGGGGAVVPEAKKYEAYAAAHPDERIASIPADTGGGPKVAMADHVTGHKHEKPKHK